MSVGLPHVIGSMHLAGQRDDHALVGQRRIGRDRDRIAQVFRPVVAVLGRAPHRANHRDRLGRQRKEVPGEGGLLDDVGALDDDRAVDLGPGELVGQEPTDVQDLAEAQVRGRDEPPLDRLDVRDRIQSRDRGEEIVARQDRPGPAAAS